MRKIKFAACLMAMLLVSSAIVAAGSFAPFQVSSSSCGSSVLDAYPASPGAWTVAYSLRKLRATYSGAAIQLMRSSDSTTLDIGFTACDPNISAANSFCGTATLTVGTTSGRVAFPSGSVVHIFNQSSNTGMFYAVGDNTVTATNSSTALEFRTGANITVGGNTNIAAIMPTGYGIDGATPSGTLFITNCGVSKFYDQSGNGFDAVQAALGNQLGYLAACNGSQPCAFGCLTGCNLKAADSATYKTAVVETFSVMTFGEDLTTANFYYPSVGYPNTTSSNAQDYRWGLVNTSNPDILDLIVNSTPFSNDPEGFGGVWRGQNLTQYDFVASSSLLDARWNGGTVFFTTASGATPTYPNAVGLYVMGDAASHGTPGTFVEALVASGAQTARNSVSANQVSYWGITSGASASAALSNPLGDGFNWNVQQLGGFAPNPPGPGAITVNGNAYNSEASWNNYVSWQCSNCTTSGGQKGDLWRFQNTTFDQWDGANRSELDGAGGGAQFNNGTTFWVAYAIQIEAGTNYTASWNIIGQMHTTGTSPVCCIFNVNYQNNTFVVSNFNATTGAENVGSRYTSGTASRGTWYHFVFKVLVSTAGNADIFQVWCDCASAGTMAQVVNLTSASLFGGNSASTAAYWKYGNYRETGNFLLPTFAVRYGNMQVCSQGADCTSKYGSSDLSAQTTAPLANPNHSFLLKRDLEPANDNNTPMWLNEVA